MPVLKKTTARTVARSAIVLDLGDLQQQAKSIIDDAQRRADALLAEAQTEAAQLIADADARGHAEGLERGLDEGRRVGEAEGRTRALESMQERLETIEGTWSDLLERWEAARHEMILSAREDVLTFALMMGRKVVHRVPAIDPTVVVDQVKEAIAVLSEPSRVAIIVHPDDRPLIEEAMPKITQILESAQHVTVRVSEDLEAGGCRIETGRGSVDASLERQIERIVQTLLPARAVDSGVDLDADAAPDPDASADADPDAAPASDPEADPEKDPS